MLLLAIGVGAPTIATAKDAIRAGVTIPEGEPVPIVTENGSGYTPGTYAIGTIILDYTVVAPAFPIGPFATFQLNLSVYDVSGRPNPGTSFFVGFNKRYEGLVVDPRSRADGILPTIPGVPVGHRVFAKVSYLFRL